MVRKSTYIWEAGAIPVGRGGGVVLAELVVVGRALHLLVDVVEDVLDLWATSKATLVGLRLLQFCFKVFEYSFLLLQLIWAYGWFLNSSFFSAIIITNRNVRLVSDIHLCLNSGSSPLQCHMSSGSRCLIFLQNTVLAEVTPEGKIQYSFKTKEIEC